MVRDLANRTFTGTNACNPYYEEQRYADQQPKQEERDRKRAIKALERLGYHVTVERVA